MSRYPTSVRAAIEGGKLPSRRRQTLKTGAKDEPIVCRRFYLVSVQRRKAAFVCGRFAQALDAALIQSRYRLRSIDEFPARYNIAPLSDVLIVRDHLERGRQGLLCRWGLIPAWAKDPSIANKMINSRAETVAEKPAFRGALKHRRCIIPVSGFYEWHVEQYAGKPVKQPFYFYPEDDDGGFGLAGITERWISPEGEIVESFSVITTVANDLMQTVHHRMPVIIKPDEYGAWLDPNNQDVDYLNSFLRSFPSGQMAMHRVSREVNRAGNEGEQLVAPLNSA